MGRCPPAHEETVQFLLVLMHLALLSSKISWYNYSSPPLHVHSNQPLKVELSLSTIKSIPLDQHLT
jgi:hypothetical protein